jgi:hypothetical protein
MKTKCSHKRLRTGRGRLFQSNSESSSGLTGRDGRIRQVVAFDDRLSGRPAAKLVVCEPAVRAHGKRGVLIGLGGGLEGSCVIGSVERKAHGSGVGCRFALASSTRW